MSHIPARQDQYEGTSVEPVTTPAPDGITMLRPKVDDQVAEDAQWVHDLTSEGVVECYEAVMKLYLVLVKVGCTEARRKLPGPS